MSPDFRELLATFNAHGVDFLIVGAHALAAHGHVRATKDLDLFIRATPENAARAYAALADFGALLHDLTEEDLHTPGTVFQIGVPPVRIDLVTEIDGVAFADAWKGRFETTLAGIPVAVLSLADLIRNKKEAGRLQDLADVEALEKLQRERPATTEWRRRRAGRPRQLAHRRPTKARISAGGPPAEPSAPVESGP